MFFLSSSSNSQETQSLSSHPSVAYTLEYHTQSMPNSTQPQSLSVDALPAYCYNMKLCLILPLKIACMLSAWPPPYGDNGGVS